MYQHTDLILSDETKLSLYLSDKQNSKWLVITHGLGEHALRHQYLFEKFSNKYNICLYDLRGHGESEGERGRIGHFNFYVQDLHEVLEFLNMKHNMKEYSLFGHSMGGLIVATYMKNLVSKELYPQKVFLSSPAVGGAGIGKAISLLPLGMHEFLVALPLEFRVKGMLNLKKLSHNPEVFNHYIHDAKNTLAISLHLFLEVLSQAKSTFSSSLEIECDLYVSIGTGDVLVDPQACIKYFSTQEPKTKLLVVKDGYHELYNETDGYKQIFIDFLEQAFAQ